MKRFVFGACALALTIGAAMAQTAPSPTPTDQPAAPAVSATPAMQTPKEVRAACRDQAVQQGLKGPARKAPSRIASPKPARTSPRPKRAASKARPRG